MKSGTQECPPADVVAAVRAALARRNRVLPSPEECRSLRLEHDLPRRVIADIVGTTVQTLGRWESGTRTPRGELRTRYQAVLDILSAQS